MSNDYLSITQFVQGFCRNVLEERSKKRIDIVISLKKDRYCHKLYYGRFYRFLMVGCQRFTV